jgi:hypothetical protein
MARRLPILRRGAQKQMGLKMARDPRAQGVVALHRFGLPPKLGSTNSIGDTRSVLLAELDKPDVALIRTTIC